MYKEIKYISGVPAHFCLITKPNAMAGCVFYTPPPMVELYPYRTSPFTRGRAVRYGWQEAVA